MLNGYYRDFFTNSVGVMFRPILHIVLAFATLGFSTVAAAATTCVGGFAGIYPCSNVDLLAHIPDYTTSGNAADVCGFMDLNSNREYVIVGYDTGTAVFEVTDAENPREVGFVEGQSNTWRDAKIYQFWNTTDNRWNAYAYISAEDAADGLLVIDLTQLPHRVAPFHATLLHYHFPVPYQFNSFNRHPRKRFHKGLSQYSQRRSCTLDAVSWYKLTLARLDLEFQKWAFGH